MSTNPFVALRKLLPPSPVWIGKVLAHHEEDDTSTVELPTRQGVIPYAGSVQAGAIIRARGRTVPVGQNAFVRDGVIENRAPDGEPTDILIGVVVETPATLAFAGPIPNQAPALGVPFLLALDPYWTGGYLPRSWSLFSGTLPAGLALNTSTGTVTGTISTSTEQADVAFRCTDFLSNVANGSARFLAVTASSDGGGAAWDTSYFYTAGSPTYFNSGFNAMLPGVGASLPGDGATLRARTAVPITAQVYCEFEVVFQTNDSNYHAFGIYRTSIGNPGILGTGNVQVFSRAPNYSSGGCGLGLDGLSINGTATTNSAYAFIPGDRIGLAIDGATGKGWVRKNGGAWIGGGNPTTGTSPSFTFTPAADWVFSHVNYTCGAAGTQVNARIYPSAATQLTAAPSGFLPYAPSTVVPTPSTLYALTASAIRRSTDGGASWTTLAAPPSGIAWDKLTRTSSGWLLTSAEDADFGVTNVAYSADLTSWTLRTETSLLGDAGNDYVAPKYSAVAQGPTRLLVWNREPDNSAYGSFSTNGGSSFGFTTFASWRFRTMIWSRRLGAFVAAQDNFIATSTDGNSWTLRYTGPSNARYDVVVECASAILFFSGSSTQSVVRSADGGTTWANVVGGGWGDTYGAAADGQRVVACRYSGETWVSTNGGVNWAEGPAGLPFVTQQRKVTWGGDAFYLLSGVSSFTIWRSPTGSNWTQVATMPSGLYVDIMSA